MEHRAKYQELLTEVSCQQEFQGIRTSWHVCISSLIGIYCYNLNLKFVHPCEIPDSRGTLGTVAIQQPFSVVDPMLPRILLPDYSLYTLLVL
jgi:hypothetical protein